MVHFMIATSMPQGTSSAWDIKRWLQESSLFPRKRQPQAEGGEDVQIDLKRYAAGIAEVSERP